MYKVLLVDDREIFIMELERLGVWGSASGFEIAGRAADGIEALRLLRTNTYDLVITDIRMPKLDGIGLLQEIKKEDLCPCVVLLSEHSEFEYARRGLVLGAFDYLIKPVEEEKIAQLLLRALRFLDAEDDFYPGAEEKNILSILGFQNERIPGLFDDAAKNLRQFLITGDQRYNEAEISPASLKRTDVRKFSTVENFQLRRYNSIVRKLYLNIVSAVFEKYGWLSLYTSVEQYENPGILKQSENNDPDVFREALCGLLSSVERLAPAGTHNTIRDVCSFILENPESEISLSSVSEKFFINNTYLSSLFRQKTGLGFNDYVTYVRMSRARFLLEHSDMKIYEISSSLGYRDADYFNRIYKKFSGSTPTDYRRNSTK